MPKDGKWKPYNVDYLEKNVREVFKSDDIGKLTKATYDFIIQHMGFIAHYDLHGFQCEYADLELFREKLQTSEYSQDPEYNLRWADRCESDRDFVKWYGEGYCKSEAEGIRRIVAVARSQYAQPMLPIPAWELRLTERR
jgi:hypothetical protein